MEPRDPEAGGAGGEGSRADEALRRLEQRLSRASEAAERLIAEASDSVRQAASGQPQPAKEPPTEPPPAGWQTPGSDRPREEGGELELLLGVVRSLRDLIPPELERRLAEALRELLLALRALIDWYLERSEQRRAGPSEVRDIPIV
jgi:hypothetical protein